MAYALIILYMAITSRMAGGGLGAHILDPKGKGRGMMPVNLTWLPEALFILPIAITCGAAVAFLFGTLWGLLAGFAGYGVSFLGMQTATEPGFNIDYKDDKTLVPYMNAIGRVFGIKPHTVGYMHLWNAMKGFLIGLPVGGVSLALLWPLAYAVGARFENHALKELLAGAGAAAAVCFAICLMN